MEQAIVEYVEFVAPAPTARPAPPEKVVRFKRQFPVGLMEGEGESWFRCRKETCLAVVPEKQWTDVELQRLKDFGARGVTCINCQPGSRTPKHIAAVEVGGRPGE